MLIDSVLSNLVVLALVYNNALVVLGPTVWSGLNPRRALVIAIAAEIAGTFLSPMRTVHFQTDYYIVSLVFYLIFTYVKISLPISVFLYSLRGLTAQSLGLWFGTPVPAFAVGYLISRTLRPSMVLGYLVLVLVSFMFGANNIAFVNKSLYVVVPIAVGNYLGLSFSRWIVRLYAFSFSGAISASLAAAALAALGTALEVPMSFTFLTYSTLLGAAAARRPRIIRVYDFLKALSSILLALFLAYATLLMIG